MKARKIQVIVDKLKAHNISLKQGAIDYLFKKDLNYLNGVIRAINSPENETILSIFANK